jgi:Xaa-Pro aminopeptidase
MRYTPLPASVFIANRARFVAQMQPKTAAIFFANDIIATNSDGHYRFTQDSNFYYLTGIDQEDCILFLFPDAPLEKHRCILFVKPTNETIQVWEGWKYSQEEAKEASGIQQVLYLNQFNDTLLHLMSHIDGFYLDFNEHDRNRIHRETGAHRFAQRLQSEFPAHRLLRCNHILQNLRMVKSSEEVAQLKRAIDITRSAFLRVLNFIKPGVMEYEVEAEVMHEFLRHGATGPAYESIIASGKNACVLHYINNDKHCHDGDLLLMDFGAEYGLYSADLTRTVPVNGRFTPRQKEVYNAVLRIHHAAKALLKPAEYTLDEYHIQVGEIATAEMLSLGLITADDVKNQRPDWPAYKKYFMHGTSHHLGLDTHDLGSRYVPFQAGMVFTCEPGIYIPEEGIGIRIENNILLTENGNIDLMAHIPMEAEAIEELMNAGK